MRQRGFTVIELLVVVTVIAILSAIALPSFSNAYMTNRLASYSNNFVASVQFARSEAIKRGVPMIMCASSNGTSCTTSASSWQPGWIVYCEASSSTATSCTSGGSSLLVLQKQDALSSSYSFTTTSPSTSGYSISFPAGGVGVSVGASSAASLKLCRSSPSAGEQERVITVSASGRTSVSTTRTGTCP